MFSNYDDGKKDDPYGNTNMAYAVTDAQPTTGTASNPFEVKKQPTRCRDPIFAVLFYANVAAIVGVAIAYSDNVFASVSGNGNGNGNDDGNQNQADDLDYSGLVYAGLCSAGFAAVLSAVMMQVMTCIPGVLIKAALIFNVILAAAMCVAGFLFGDMIGGIFGLVIFALMACYAKLVWSRIPFATANLKTGCAIIRANCGVTIIGYVFMALGFAWTALWSFAVAGVQDEILPNTCVDDGQGGEICQTNPSYGYFFLLFLSLFFTQQVLQNCIHCSVAGVAGSWWFDPSSVGCCTSAVIGSLIRTVTTSFGSICFGSLLVAIIQAVRELANQARQNDEYGQMLACCIDCILGCLEGIIEYFNKWAFVYVGLYGYSYCEAGKSVMELFRDRGWEAIIADDLVGMVLFMVSLIVGLLTGAFAIIFSETTDWFDGFPADLDPRLLVFLIGLIVGLLLCSIPLSVIASSVNAVIVLFAEGPADFEKNYPELSAEMRQAYSVAHPGCI